MSNTGPVIRVFSIGEDWVFSFRFLNSSGAAVAMNGSGVGYKIRFVDKKTHAVKSQVLDTSASGALALAVGGAGNNEITGRLAKATATAWGKGRFSADLIRYTSTTEKRIVPVIVSQVEDGDTDITHSDGIIGAIIDASTFDLNGPAYIIHEGPSGPAPAHEISGTQIRFKNPDGTWGAWLDTSSLPLPARLGEAAQTVTDWNSANKNGWFMAAPGASNAPVPASWTLGSVQFHGGTGWCTQTVHSFTDDSSADTKTYRREQNDGTWGAWYRLLQSEVELDAHYQPTGFRNRIINGGFDIWQRGTSNTFEGNAPFVADRWNGYANQAATKTVTRVSAPAGFGGRYAINTAASAVPAGTYIDYLHRIEGGMLADMAGKPATLSFYFSGTTSAGSLSGSIYILANTALDDDSLNGVGFSGSFTIPATGARIIANIPAVGTVDFKNGVQVYIRSQQNGAAGDVSLTLGRVQLECGVVANPFEFRPLGVELALCQRYFETSYSGGLPPGSVASSPFLHALDAAQSYASINCPFKVTKRATPTVTIYSPGTGAAGKVYNQNAAADLAAVPTNPATVGFSASVSGVSVAQSHSIAVHWTASAEI